MVNIFFLMSVGIAQEIVLLRLWNENSSNFVKNINFRRTVNFAYFDKISVKFGIFRKFLTFCPLRNFSVNFLIVLLTFDKFGSYCFNYHLFNSHYGISSWFRKYLHFQTNCVNTVCFWICWGHFKLYMVSLLFQ